MMPKKKNPIMTNHKRIALWVAASIVLLCVSGFGTYMLLETYLPRKTEQKTTQQTTQPTPAPASASPSEIVDAIKSSYEARYTILNLEENNQPRDGELAIALSKDAPLWQVEGYDFYNDYNNGASIRLAAFEPIPAETVTNLPTTADSKLRTELATLLIQQGLKKSAEIQPNTKQSDIDTYISDRTVCEVESTDAATSLTHVSCGEIEQYKAAAKEYKPFVDLIAEESETVSETTLVSDLAIRKSDTDGYRVATLSYFNATALFYTLEDGTWTYFTTTQNILACADYNTVDLQAAFRGESCIDATGVEAVLL